MPIGSSVSEDTALGGMPNEMVQLIKMSGNVSEHRLVKERNEASIGLQKVGDGEQTTGDGAHGRKRSWDSAGARAAAGSFRARRAGRAGDASEGSAVSRVCRAQRRLG